RKETQPVAQQTSKSSAASKPNSERLSKTVMPNMTRAVTSQETSENATAALNEGTFESPSVTPRAISFGPKKKAVKELPPAVALALEPRVERAISLDLADVLNRLPEGTTK